MQRQQYPDKAPYKKWKLINNGGESLEQQLSNWHKEHPSFAITQHQYGFVGGENGNGIEFLTLTYFDLDEAEKDVDPEFRTPRNEFYFHKSVEPLESGISDEFSSWYENNDIDIISVSSYIDTKNLTLVSGYIYVDRAESKAAYDLKYERQQAQIKKMSEEMAKKQLAKEAEKKK